MFFEEKEPGIFVRNKNFHIKNKNFWADENFKEIDDFCFRIRDGITNIIENVNIDAAENMSKRNFPHYKMSWRRKMKVKSLMIQTKTLGQ